MSRSTRGSSSFATKRERAARANEFLRAVAGCGRGFFQRCGRVSSFEVDDRGRIFFRDAYTLRAIYTHDTRGRWRGFTEGGTMRCLVIYLRDFIRTGEQQNLHLGPWPQWVCDGDLWGYGQDMELVRAAAVGIQREGAVSAISEAPAPGALL
jgi:hypothetical protein